MIIIKMELLSIKELFKVIVGKILINNSNMYRKMSDEDE